MRDHDNTVNIERKNYLPPSHWISRVDLQFDLEPDQTTVSAELHFSANPLRDNGNAPLRLDGEALELHSIAVDGVELSRALYSIDDKGITLTKLPQSGVLRTVVSIAPVLNTRLEGLYVSNGNFFTQCEAEGFRRITYFPDRPDVMAKYVVTMRADREKLPVLLSNGNLIAEGDLENGRHYAVWEDPFPKPCYLFALVAGNLVCEEKTITRASGKPALLQVWVELGQLENTGHAMESLVKSIRWDESRFGVELDLDRFMIVAVGDFNMGAMENKGLNIFNSKFVLANPSIATDVDYDNIESIVGHEYFHNWTGNRVTCRDWFQLSLKEGLTVFRDQEFSADMMAAGLSPAAADSARAVKRIEDVKVLRAAQFPEDSGPMDHPIRPDSYVEINNFYTVTVYEKGAEVVRMQQTLLGKELFRRGMDIYFARHDGQAVTCDDFVNAMETALQEKHPERDLQQFRRWYSQAGTPHVSCTGSYDNTNKTYALTLKQSCPPTPGQASKEPFHIPFALGLIGLDGNDIALHGAGIASRETSVVLSLTEPEQTFVFENVATAPVPSLLRGFSAPVIVQAEQSIDDLIFLLSYDSDAFNRWEAGQRLFASIILEQIKSTSAEIALPESVLMAIAGLIDNSNLSPAYRSLLLQLPSEVTLAEQLSGNVDPTAIHKARQAVRKTIGLHFQQKWLEIVEKNHITQSYTPSSEQMGIRSLRGLALSLLCDANSVEGIEWAQHIFSNANNMTERLASLTALVHSNQSAGDVALTQFEADWANNSLVLDKWYTVQATCPDATPGSTLAKVKTLLNHPQFSFKTPNKVRALVSSFCHSNTAAFHAEDGGGYAFWADMVIKLDPTNPQVAARLARAMDRWTRFTPARQVLMKNALTRVSQEAQLSNDVREVVEKAICQLRR